MRRNDGNYGAKGHINSKRKRNGNMWVDTIGPEAFNVMGSIECDGEPLR